MATAVAGADFVIVGSGAGGGTLAYELASRGRDVMVIERGPQARKVGTSLSIYPMYRIRKSKEGTRIYSASMLGGTTMVSCGNGVACLEDELRQAGVDIHEELLEALDDTKTVPLPERLLSDASKRILEAATAMGLDMRPMPKLVDVARCQACGDCVLGCKQNAKWTSLRPLAKAKLRGARVITDTTVAKVIVSGGRATGVEIKGPGGVSQISAGTVIIAAGGLDTPVILQRSGVEQAGKNLFADLYDVTMGVTGNLTQVNEPSMAMVDTEFHDSKGFLLSPFIFPKLTFQQTLGLQGVWRWPQQKRIVGIMTKIRDDCAGRVYADGTIEKPVTGSDKTKLDAGSEISREILGRIGVPGKQMFSFRGAGAHPGGTAAVGQVVDTNLRTEIEGLYVCDASLLPEAPGYPPIIAIVALAKRLGKTLTA